MAGRLLVRRTQPQLDSAREWKQPHELVCRRHGSDSLPDDSPRREPDQRPLKGPDLHRLHELAQHVGPPAGEVVVSPRITDGPHRDRVRSHQNIASLASERAHEVVGLLVSQEVAAPDRRRVWIGPAAQHRANALEHGAAQALVLARHASGRAAALAPAHHVRTLLTRGARAASRHPSIVVSWRHRLQLVASRGPSPRRPCRCPWSLVPPSAIFSASHTRAPWCLPRRCAHAAADRRSPRRVARSSIGTRAAGRRSSPSRFGRGRWVTPCARGRGPCGQRRATTAAGLSACPLRPWGRASASGASSAGPGPCTPRARSARREVRRGNRRSRASKAGGRPLQGLCGISQSGLLARTAPCEGSQRASPPRRRRCERARPGVRGGTPGRAGTKRSVRALEGPRERPQRASRAVAARYASAGPSSPSSTGSSGARRPLAMASKERSCCSRLRGKSGRIAPALLL